MLTPPQTLQNSNVCMEVIEKWRLDAPANMLKPLVIRRVRIPIYIFKLVGSIFPPNYLQRLCLTPTV